MNCFAFVYFADVMSDLCQQGVWTCLDLRGWRTQMINFSESTLPNLLVRDMEERKLWVRTHIRAPEVQDSKMFLIFCCFVCIPHLVTFWVSVSALWVETQSYCSIKERPCISMRPSTAISWPRQGVLWKMLSAVLKVTGGALPSGMIFLPLLYQAVLLVVLYRLYPRASTSCFSVSLSHPWSFFVHWETRLLQYITLDSSRFIYFTF